MSTAGTGSPLPEAPTSLQLDTETFETKHRHFEEFVIDRWMFLKENSNAFTWKRKFIERNFLNEKDIKDSGNSEMERAELAEWLLIKSLQKIQTLANIKLIESVIFKDGIGEERMEHIPLKESTDNLEVVMVRLSKYQNDIEEALKREDAVKIKDQLMQDRIIELTENEKLIKDEKRFDDGTTLISAVMNIIKCKLKLGSYQSFIKSLYKLEKRGNKKKRRQPITKLIHKLENEFIAESTPSGWHTLQVDTLHSEFYDKKIEGKNDFTLTMVATSVEGKEDTQAYSWIMRNSEARERILAGDLAGESQQIRNGSLVIHFRLIERNMQAYLKDCLKSGNVSTVVQKLFREIAIEDIIPVGKIQLTVKIEVNEDSCLPEPLPEHSSTINNFVLDNRSFIKEEMDTDILEEELKKIGKSIVYKSGNGRKEKADQILDFILANKLEEHFVRVIKTNEENRFASLLKRIETYEQIYETEASCLRKNVLTQFSEIVKVIDIDDIREVLLERNTVTEHSLNDIDDRFSNNREIGMATLLLKILKSGDAVRAFVDALFIMRSAFAEHILICRSELVVIEEDSKVAICDKSKDDNLLFDGCFNIIIDKMGSDIPNTIQHCTVLPTQNVDMVTNYIDSLALTDDKKIEYTRRLHEDGGSAIQFISIDLYNYLCQNIVGTEEHLKTIRMMNNVRDNLQNYKHFTIITSGSVGEGLQMRGSDLDILAVLTDVEVCEDMHIDINADKIYFIMEMDDTRPGFSMLRLLHSYNQSINEVCNQIGNAFYISNHSFKNKCLTSTCSTIHGPCITNEVELNDIECCLQSKLWIAPARRWVTRSNNAWPSYDVKQAIVNHGVQFIPVGVKGSSQEELEWRISFSVGEKLLIYSFTHTQLLCYALMKILLKDVIALDRECKDSLCSYFLKTVLFWICEELPSSVWKPANLISCFMRCFRRLMYCVKYAVCPHYFIPENDLFENDMQGHTQKTLEKKLNILDSYGWQCILLSDQISNIYALAFDIGKESSYLHVNLIQQLLTPTMFFADIMWKHFDSPFKKVIHKLFSCYSSKLKYLYTYYMSKNCCRSEQLLPIDDMSGNKSTYKRYNTYLSTLLLSTRHDAVSGWLMVASFFYKTKQYSKALSIVQHSLLKCSPENIHLIMTLSDNHKYLFNSHVFRKMTFVQLRKFFISEMVTFTPNSMLIPDEFQMDEQFIVIPPVVYALFLSFLCHYHLNNKQYWDSLWCLKMITDENNFIQSRNVIYDMLGKSFILVGDKESARQAFIQSAGICKK